MAARGTSSLDTSSLDTSSLAELIQEAIIVADHNSTAKVYRERFILELETTGDVSAEVIEFLEGNPDVLTEIVNLILQRFLFEGDLTLENVIEAYKTKYYYRGCPKLVKSHVIPALKHRHFDRIKECLKLVGKKQVYQILTVYEHAAIIKAIPEFNGFIPPKDPLPSSGQKNGTEFLKEIARKDDHNRLKGILGRCSLTSKILDFLFAMILMYHSEKCFLLLTEKYEFNLSYLGSETKTKSTINGLARAGKVEFLKTISRCLPVSE